MRLAIGIGIGWVRYCFGWARYRCCKFGLAEGFCFWQGLLVYAVVRSGLSGRGKECLR